MVTARRGGGIGVAGAVGTARLAGAVAAGGLGLAAAAWARGLAAATTMEADHAAYWRRRARSPGTLTLVALGDSLAQGMGALDPSDSWAGRLATTLEARAGRPVRVRCLGVCGAAAADVLAGQLPGIPDLLAPRSDVLVALAVGTNDAARGVDPATFRARLEALCAALPPGSLVADVPDLQRGAVRRAGVALAAVAREVVETSPGLRLVRLEEATHRMRPWEFGPDLGHPNGRGYRRHGRAFAAALDD